MEGAVGFVDVTATTAATPAEAAAAEAAAAEAAATAAEAEAEAAEAETAAEEAETVAEADPLADASPFLDNDGCWDQTADAASSLDAVEI